MGTFDTMPGMNWPGIEQTLRERVFGAVLEYRTAYDEFEPFLGKAPAAWELRCSGCGQTFCINKARDLHVSKLEFCPCCGRPVRATRWRTKPKEECSVLLKVLLRGEGREVWMRCWRVKLLVGGNDGAFVSGYEKHRFRFSDGSAVKWATKYDWDSDGWGWAEQKNTDCVNWNVNPYSSTVYAPVVYLDGCGLLDEDSDFSGTCIEYSAFQELLYYGENEMRGGPLEGYLALYAKHPIIEYLVKGGFALWADRYLEGCDKKEFRAVVNLRAKSPKKLLRGLTQADAKALRGHSVCVAATYRELRAAGVITIADDAAASYAHAVYENGRRYQKALAAAGDAAKLRRYLERQARRDGQSVRIMLHDYADYAEENMDDLGLQPGEFDAFPADLLAAHTRLTSRLKRKAKREFASQFRAVRRALRPVRWSSGGLFIRAVDSPFEIVREGEEQENCVAGYQKKHAGRGSYILLLRLKEYPRMPLYTVEWDARKNKVIQCRGFKNRRLAPETEEQKDEFLAAWTERNERLFREGKLSRAI